MTVNTGKVSLALVLSALMATAIGCGSSVTQSSPSASAEISATPAASPTPDLFQGSLADLRAAVGKIHAEDVAGELTWCGVKSTDPKTEDCELTDLGVTENLGAYPVVSFTQGYTRAKYDFLGLDPNFDARNASVVTKIACEYRLTETGYMFVSGTYTNTTSGHEAYINGTDVKPLTDGNYVQVFSSGYEDVTRKCPGSK
jgi:hypothetical protein